MYSSSDSEEDISFVTRTKIQRPDEVRAILNDPTSTKELPQKFIEEMKNLKIARYERAGYNSESFKDIVFTAVGMRFYGNHSFSMDDVITLEKEDSNPKDSNAIKIFVEKSNNEGMKVKTHVAYVAREDTSKLRRVDNFEKYKVKLVRSLRASADLRLLLNEYKDEIKEDKSKDEDKNITSAVKDLQEDKDKNKDIQSKDESK